MQKGYLRSQSGRKRRQEIGRGRKDKLYEEMSGRANLKRCFDSIGFFWMEFLRR
jgi:hypothetical protein